MSNPTGQFLTPYRMVMSVMSKLKVKTSPRTLKLECLFAKRLLERLRADKYDDVTIGQMIDYVCQGMMREGAPRDFRYFYGIMRNFLDSSVTQEVAGNVQDISTYIPQKEKDVDNPI